jgi:phosphate transport system protein
MSVHLHREIEELKRRILNQGTLVEETVRKALTAVASQDARLAREVIDGDEGIDMAEVAIEEECLKILALHQPVATDLRFIVAVLKINSDLERIGDLAANIASRAMKLSQITTAKEANIDFQNGEAKVQQMLRQSFG